MTNISDIELGAVLAGARPFKEGNINDTYKGQVLLSGDRIVDAVIKDIPKLELCNELLSYSLATQLGIPVPRGLLAVARPENLITKHAPNLGNGAKAVFASQDVQCPSLVTRVGSKVIADFAPLINDFKKWLHADASYGFDTWLANVDRNLGNILIGSPKDFWLIDHGQCFNAASWAQNLAHNDFPHKMANWLNPQLTSSEKSSTLQAIQKLELKIKSIDLSDLFSQSKITMLLSHAEKKELFGFLEDRGAYVSEKSAAHLGIPMLKIVS